MPALDTRFPDTHDTLAADAPTDQALARSDTLLARTLASDRLPVPVASDPDTRTGGAARSPEQGEAPTTLGRYHVLERLGAGGMGVVFTAYDPDLDRKVAVKLLRADRSHESQVRLLREAQALARLSHPNVVQIHDAGVIGEQIFIAMEFVRGHDLRGWLTAQPRTPTEILRLFVDAGRGLAAAHAVGLIHRDFKPENVLVGADGRARVADFGLARADHDAAPGDRTSPTDQPLELSLTATGAVLGTPAYMSPEQHMGLDVAAASDQFSFCVALWEALCGQRPFAGETYAETSVAVLTGQLRDPPPAARLPRRLVDALRRGLATRPEQRHPDMPALLANLARDAPRTRGPWLAAAVLSTMAAGTAFALADWRAGEASACTGAAAELADTWDDDRRAAVAAALPEPTRALVGLDRYADEWTAAHRDACLDHRRGELSAARFDDRARCLDRRRRALASAVDVLTAPGTAPDSAQVVARLPSIATCNDPEAARLATYVPGDPALADVVRDLDDRLLAAQTRHHAGDLTGARATLAPVIAEARALDIRPLLGEALLLLGQLDAESLQPNLGRPSFAEAAVHALASQRDALAAEALARQIFVDAHLGATDRALEAAPIARALAERLPAPAAALARLEHNLGTVHLLGLHDRDAALAKFRRAAADLARAADHDPLELANYSLDVAVATRDPDERRSEFTRAEQLLSERLGPDHVRTLEVQWQRGLHEPDPRTAAALLAEVCPRLLALHPELHESCAYCFYNLGLLRGELTPTEPALAELTRQDECEDHTAADPGLRTAIAIRRGSASAFTALAAGRPADALADTDAALVLTGPHRELWWISAYHAELQLARGRALAALGRPDEARTALTEAIAGLETAGTMRPLPVYSLWLPSARALLGRLEP